MAVGSIKLVISVVEVMDANPSHNEVNFQMVGSLRQRRQQVMDKIYWSSTSRGVHGSLVISV